MCKLLGDARILVFKEFSELFVVVITEIEFGFFNLSIHWRRVHGSIFSNVQMLTFVFPLLFYSFLQEPN